MEDLHLTKDATIEEIEYLVKSMFDWLAKGEMVNLSKILIDLTLKEDQIWEKDLSQLKSSLFLIENLINLVDSGIRNNSLSKEKTFTIAKFLNLLFPMKSLIIHRIQDITSREEIKKIASQASEINETNLQKQIENMLKINEEWQQKLIENGLDQKHILESIEEKKHEIALRREDREAFKEKWAVWRSFLEKESVSTIVGAFLLIIITIALLVAMFNHINTSEIINNSFLVLLGYFFGQSVAKAASHKKSNN